MTIGSRRVRVLPVENFEAVNPNDIKTALRPNQRKGRILEQLPMKMAFRVHLTVFWKKWMATGKLMAFM
ncbi:MAG: hypothetical protein JXA78_18760 [Anaerolineales bacterium]|nr:hypothetical protein [Anaerolineales bacterium]